MRNFAHKFSTFFLIFQIIFIFSFSIFSNEFNSSRAYEVSIMDSMSRGEKNGVHIDEKNKVVYVSKTFKWLKYSYEKSDGVKDFVSNYIKGDVSDYDIKYVEYNWDLNG